MINEYQKVQVAHVYDGDTVRLASGEKVRIIGVNTPELGRDGAADMPFSVEAKRRLESLIKSGDVGMIKGRETHDRYGRLLAHIVVDGKLVAENLLLKGLGYQVAIYPNTAYWQCLLDAEDTAQSQARGLWAQAQWRSIHDLGKQDGGYQLIQGDITSVRKKGDFWFLNVDKDLLVKVHKSALEGRSVSALMGRSVKLKGWIIPKSTKDPKHYSPWFMRISHRSSIKIN